tara:strand:+ start:588 stop:1364 length:777 start_codon:yes stop_codon:yes gene_type:complete
MSKDTKILSKPINDGSSDDQKPVSGVNLDSFIPSAGLEDIAAATNNGINEQLHLHQEKIKPAKKSEPAPDPNDINTHPKKWYETDIFGKLKYDENGKPKKKTGRPKKAKKGDKLVGGGTWPPATASTIKDQPTEQPGATPGQEPKRMDLGKEAGEVLTGHMERLGQAIGGEKAKPTPEEKKVISESLSASLGEWQIYPPLALLAFSGLFLIRVFLESKFIKKDKDNSSNGSKTHDVPRDNGKRQDGTSKAAQWDYADI